MNSNGKSGNGDRPDAIELAPAAAQVIQSGQIIQGVRTQHQAIVLSRTPRSERMAQIKTQIAEEAAELGEAGIYEWEAAGNQILGMSADLAKGIASFWGSIAFMDFTIEDLPNGKRRLSETVIDAEAGTSQISVWEYTPTPPPGKFANKQDQRDRWDSMQLNANISKLRRNSVAWAVPRSIINKAIEEARSKMYDKIKAFVKEHGMAGAIREIAKGLAKHGVAEAQLSAHMGKDTRSPELWTIKDIANLRTLLAAIQDGEAIAAEIFPKTAVAEPQAQTVPTADDLLGKQPAAKQEASAEKPPEPPAEEPPDSSGDEPDDEPAPETDAPPEDEPPPGGEQKQGSETLFGENVPKR